MTRIHDYFAGKHVFVTGASGFLGLALLDKLLRYCPDIAAIWILLRPKKGHDLSTRFESLVKNPIFVKLIEQNPHAFEKVHYVAGDIGDERLGLSASDEQTLADRIEIIFHSAATLDFEASLVKTTHLNYEGTKKVLELAKKCSRLSSFVYVSSAYANSFRLECREQLYPLLRPVDEVRAIVRDRSETEIARDVAGILRGHPNTYTFTKQMAEHEVAAYAHLFPCAIVRPSMITGAWKEPYAGWTCSKNGPAGFFMGAARGIVRRLPVGENLIYDYIPVDVVINELIAAAFFVHRQRSREPAIFHCTSSTRNPFRWANMKHDLNPNLRKYPICSAVWFPNLRLMPSVWRYKFSAIFVHFIPAYLLDFVLMASGKKRMLVTLHKRVNDSLNRLAKFIYTEWAFHADQSDELQRFLAREHPDNILDFSVSIADLNWRHYCTDMAVGVRQYLNNEKPHTLMAARRKNRILCALHVLLKLVLFYGTWCIVARLMCGVKCGWTSFTVAALVYHLFFNIII